MAGSKRSRGDTSNISQQGNDGPNKRITRVTRSASQAQNAEAGGHQATETQRLDTAASPAQPGHAIHAPFLLPPRPRPDHEATINKLSTVASKYLDAQAHARFLHNVQVDDNLVEIAYQRGLLATFIVTPPSNPEGSPPSFNVEAPEFASVEYLKRRITRAELLNSDELYVYDRFYLRRMPAPGTHGQEAARQMKEIDEKVPSTNIPMLLFNLGFRGGETYHIRMISKADTNDKAQQEKMIRDAAAAGAQKRTPLEDPVAREYQELLNGGPLNAEAEAPAPRAPAAPAARAPLPVAQKIISPTRAPPAPTAPAAGGNGGDNGGGDNGGGGGGTPVGSGPSAMPSPGNNGNNEPQVPPRSPQYFHRAGRWAVLEVEALVGGVQQYGYNWKEIKEAFDEIDSRRTTVDLKDKWRNLVKSCKDPQRATRTMGYSEVMKALILELAERSS